MSCMLPLYRHKIKLYIFMYRQDQLSIEQIPAQSYVVLPVAMTTVVVCCALIGGVVSFSIIDCDVCSSVVLGCNVVTLSNGVVCVTVPIIQ